MRDFDHLRQVLIDDNGLITRHRIVLHRTMGTGPNRFTFAPTGSSLGRNQLYTMRCVTQPDANPQAPGCHLVRMPDVPARIRPRAESTTLPRDVLVKLETCAEPWRRSEYIVKNLRRIIAEHDLPGIAMLYVGPPRSLLPPPPPLTMFFEPTVLNDTAKELRNLLLVEPDKHNAHDRPPKPKRIHYRVLATILLSWLPLVILQSCLYSVDFMIIVPYLLFIFVAVHPIRLHTLGQRIIIPGGLLVRRWTTVAWNDPLTRFTPTDTILLVRHRDRSPGWQVELWQGDNCRRYTHTALECYVLLGAWQSPHRAASLDQMTDWSQTE